MPSSEMPEKSGNPVSYPRGGSFAELLDWHLNNGTRPDGRPGQRGKRWGAQDFAHAVGGVNERTVRYWRRGESRPNDLHSIEQTLFNKNAAYDAWSEDLHAAYDGFRQPELTSPIPSPPEHFLGRGKDIETIVDALLTAPGPLTVLVQGGPGIGKTALTKTVGHHPEVVRRFGQANRWFVELETATTATAMQDAIIRALGGDPARGFKAVLDLLRLTPGLLVLDNLETPWDARNGRQATEATLTALAAIPGLALLASFRGDDPVRGLAWARIHPVAHLDPPDDADLFRRIANWQRRDDPDLPRLVAALGGVPLAIELIAQHAYGQASLAPLWRRWAAKGAEMARHPDFDRGRLTSLPHSIELSLASSRLTPAAYRLFCLLGRLPAGLAEQDRDALLGDDGFEAQGALRRIGLAINRASRLDLLPPIRDHAGRHHGTGEPDATAWPAHYLGLTRDLGDAIGTRAGEGAVGRLVPEFPNIEAAIRTAIDAGRRLEVMAVLGGLGRLTYIASLPAPVLIDLTKACRREGDVQGEADCVKSLGDIALARSDHDAARQAYDTALPLYRQVGDVQGEANCVQRLGDIALRRSDHDAARQAYDTALALYRQVGDVQGEATCVQRLGDIALARSDHDAARQAYDTALPLYRQVGDVLGEANCVQRLGDIALRRSDHDAARQAYDTALALYRQVGDVLGEANCVQRLGDIALARSDHDAARQAYDTALALYRQVGAVLGEANCVQSLGDIALRRSDHDDARQAYDTALALYRQVGAVQGEANCVQRLGDIALARSDHDAARQAYDTALALYRQVGDVQGEANCVQSLGDIALRRSDHDAARQAYDTALPLYRQVGDVQGEATCVQRLGDIALARSDHDDARQAYDTALALYRQVGAVLGEANCVQSLGDIALARSDHDDARQAYDTALALYRQVGAVLGEANCVQSLGDIALARSDHDAARQAYDTALALYRQVGDVLGEANCVQRLGDIALARSDHDAARQAYDTALALYRQVGAVQGEANCVRGLKDLKDRGVRVRKS